MAVHFEAQNPITGESLPLTGQEIIYGFNLSTSEKFEQTLAWLLDQINDERINDGEEYWYFSRQIRDLAWDEMNDEGYFDAETYMNPITGDPNFVLVTEDIRDGEYERREHFVIDAESEAKMTDKEILEWQYGEGSVDEYDAANAEFWVHDERIHTLEFQPISLSDALVLERLGVASRNYPYQDREAKKAEGESPDGFNKSLVAIDLEYEDARYSDYFIVHTNQISGFSEQELVNYFYDLEEEDWTDENTFEPMMSYPTEVQSVMVSSLTPEEEKVLIKFGISGRYL